MITKIKDFLFINRSTSQTLAKNTLWLTFGQIGGRLLRSAVIIYAARVLGAAQWGIFSYALSLAGLLTIFTDLGIGPLLTREVSRVETVKERQAIISTSFIVRLISLGIAALIILFLTPYVTTIPEVILLLPAIALITSFDTLREFGSSVARAIEKMEIETFLYLATNVAIVGFGFLFLILSPTVQSFSYAYVIGTGLGTLLTFIALRETFRGILSHFDFGRLKVMFTAGLPFAIAGILGGLLINTDILVLGYFRPVEEVGWYSATQRLIQLLYLLPGIFAIAIFPVLSRLSRDNDEKIRNLLEKVIGVSMLISLPMAAGGIVTALPLMTLIFGSGYIPAALSFQILLLTLVVNFTATIISNAIFAYDQQKTLIVFSAIGVVLNLVLDLLFVPAYGLNGSAWATFFAQLIANAYLWHAMNKINRIKVFGGLKKIFLATILMAAISWLMLQWGVPVVVVILAAILSYFFFLYILREPLLKEMRVILQRSS